LDGTPAAATQQVCGPKAADVFSLNNPGLEGTRSSGLAPLFLPILNMAKKSGAIFILALMIVALSVRQRQSIEKQKTHRKVFWHPGLKQSLLLVFTVSSGMLLTGCGHEEYTSLAEAQKVVCSSPPCPQYCQECVKLRWDGLVDIDKETIHHWWIVSLSCRCDQKVLL